MTPKENSKETARAAASLPTVLFVDDDNYDFALAYCALQKIKLRNPIQIVSTADELFRYLDGEKPFDDRAKFPMPAVIILDLLLPELAAIRIQAMLRASLKFRHICIIAIGNPDKKLALQTAVDCGANGYLFKPFTGEAFRNIAARLGMPVEFAAD